MASSIRLLTRFPARLYLWATLLIVGVAVGIAGLIMAYGTRAEEEEARLLTELRISEAAAGIGERVAAVEGALRSYAPTVARMLDRPDSLMALIDGWALAGPPIVGGRIGFEPDYYPDKGRYYMPSVTTTLGNKPVRSYPGSDSYDYHGMEWYRTAREARRGIWTEPYYDDCGGDVLVVSYALPLLDGSGQVVAVMAADVALDEMLSGCNDLSPWNVGGSMVVGNGGKLLVDPRHGARRGATIFSYADSVDSEELRQFGLALGSDTGSGRECFRVEGREMLVSYATVAGPEWVLVAFTPRDEVDGGRRALAVAAWLLLAAALAGVMLAIRYEARRSERTISSLSAEVEATASLRKSMAGYVAAIRQSATEQARIQSELDIARAIQRETMPLTFPTTAGGDGIDVYALLRPVDTAGEDFYDFLLAGDRFYFCIGTVDCAASVAASLLMTAACSVFRSAISAGQEPGITLRAMGDVLSDSPERAMSVSMLVGSLNLSDGELCYANAGHPSPLLVSPDGMVELLGDPEAGPLGAAAASGNRAAAADYKEVRLTLAPEARIVLYTAGIITASNSGGAAYTDTTLYHHVTLIVANHPGLSARELVERIDRYVRGHMADEPQQSDQALLSFTYSRK